jgi:hypothetical protein
MSISPLILISEFVIVDHGKYIVRVSALSNNVVVGTGLAGADTVEKAEDEARKRAIEVIDWANNFTPQIINQNTSSSSFTQKEQKLSSPINTPSITAQEQINNINTSAASTAETPKTTSSIRPPVIPQNDSQKTPTLNLNSKPEAIENKEEKTIPSSISKNETRQIETNNDEDNLPLTEETKITQSNNTQPKLDLTSLAQPVNPVDTKTNSVDNVVANHSTTAPSREMTGTMDFSQIINQTTIELKRLGWTQEDGKKYLLATYGKKSRHLLSDEELIEFLKYLQQQP